MPFEVCALGVVLGILLHGLQLFSDGDIVLLKLLDLSYLLLLTLIISAQL